MTTRTIEADINYDAALDALGDINAIIERMQGFVITDEMRRNALLQIQCVLDLVVTETDEGEE